MVYSITYSFTAAKHVLIVLAVIIFISACSEKQDGLFVPRQYSTGFSTSQDSIFESPSAPAR
jgi:hypothetical protein